MSTCNEDTSTTVAIISGALLVASEILPYIKSTDGNGLVHGLIKVLKKFVKTPRQIQSNDTADLPV